VVGKGGSTNKEDKKKKKRGEVKSREEFRDKTGAETRARKALQRVVM